jgi:hypothetical protein
MNFFYVRGVFVMIRSATLCVLLLAAATGRADPPRVDHFEGEPAPSLAAALANLEEYNAQLAAVLEREALTPDDLHTVHQLTYTLENALARIAEDVDVIAEHLEAVHIASEQADTATVRDQGRSYLERVGPFNRTQRNPSQF